MRLLMVTAGAGRMYCGSCLRDNALATELMARGHDVTLLPVYTPTLTDEENVSETTVLFGGVSVYLEQHLPLFRRTPAVLDRLWDAAPVIRALAGRSVAVDPQFLGELTVSTLKGEQGFQAKEIRKLEHWLAQQSEGFDLTMLPNALLIGLAPAIKRATGKPVGVTLQGEDLFVEGLQEPWRAESLELMRQQVGAVDGFVAVSHYYARFMADWLGIPGERIHTVPLGISLAGHGPVERSGESPFTLGYFARIAPEKGLHLLAETWCLLRQQGALPEDARLEVAGYLAPEHADYLKDVERRLREAGRLSDFHYRGVLDREQKIRFLQGLDVLCVPSPYREPKGLYVLEALANGVPVVSPRHGSFPEVIEATGGGLLADPDDPTSFAARIRELVADPERARAMGRRAAEVVGREYGTSRMAETAMAALERISRLERAAVPPRAATA
jgi:glycosyltransferase involved in cell wall biosynthesis